MAETPKPAHKGKRVNWEKVKREYVSNPTVTMAQLAKKYGVSDTAVETHASKGGWTQLRKTASSTGEVMLIENIGQQQAEINDKHAKAYRMHQYVLQRRWQLELAKMQKLENSSTETVRVGDSEVPIVETRGLMNGKALSDLMNATKLAIDGERVAMGLPTTVTKTENDHKLVNPFQGYNDDQLRKFIEVTDEQLRDYERRAIQSGQSPA